VREITRRQEGRVQELARLTDAVSAAVQRVRVASRTISS
jgi:hypothetical protein